MTLKAKQAKSTRSAARVVSTTATMGAVPATVEGFGANVFKAGRPATLHRSPLVILLNFTSHPSHQLLAAWPP